MEKGAHLADERHPTSIEKYIGTAWGLATGDSVGYPVEFMTNEEKRDMGGSEMIYHTGNVGDHPKGVYSDDTQMSIAVANGLLRSETTNVDEIMYHIGREFVTWYDSEDNDRAPGNTCMGGVRNIKDGLDWRISGIDGGNGCGAAMRSAPIGLAFYNDLDKLKEIASASAVCTHNSKSAEATAIANAYLVARGIRNEDPTQSLEAVRDFTRGISSGFTYKLDLLEDVLAHSPETAFRVIGEGWKGNDAVAGALYCALKTDFNHRDAILMAADNAGDADSVASIAGGIVGAHMGHNAIDRSFLKRLENRDGLRKLAVDLHEKFEES
jgi:ADP-ribosylglycohydrolase